MDSNEELFKRACDFVKGSPAENGFNGPTDYGITKKELEALQRESGRSLLAMISYQNPIGANETRVAVERNATTILAFRVRPNLERYDSLFQLLPKYFTDERPYECLHSTTIESEVPVGDESDDTYKVDIGLWKRV